MPARGNKTEKYFGKKIEICRFSLRTGEWEEIGKMRVGRRSAGVVSHKGHIFAVGGMGGKKDLKTIEMWSPVSKKWSLLPSSLSTLSGWISAAVIDKPLRLLQ